MLRPMLDALPRPLAFVLRHLLIGVPLAAAIALFFALAFDNRFFTNFVYSLCIGLICQFVIDGGRRGVARLMGREHWPGLPLTVLIILGGVVIGIQGGYALAGWLLGSPIPSPGLQQWRTLVIIVTVSLTASAGFTLVSWGRARLAASEARAERAQRAAAENQLRLLQSQLEPHMLFNTLANLRVLIGMDPPRAQAMLDRLIAFLRCHAQASRSDTAPPGRRVRAPGRLPGADGRAHGPAAAGRAAPAARPARAARAAAAAAALGGEQHPAWPGAPGRRAAASRCAPRATATLLVLTVLDTGAGLAARRRTGRHRLRHCTRCASAWPRCTARPHRAARPGTGRRHAGPRRAAGPPAFHLSSPPQAPRHDHEPPHRADRRRRTPAGRSAARRPGPAVARAAGGGHGRRRPTGGGPGAGAEAHAVFPGHPHAGAERPGSGARAGRGLAR
jgi:hypothetical protein